MQRHKHNVIPPQLRYTVGAAGYKPRHLRDAMQLAALFAGMAQLLQAVAPGPAP